MKKQEIKWTEEELKHEWTKEELKKLTDTIGKGLVSGLGNPIPGQMCIEAAICFAKDLPHGDSPPCVHRLDRDISVALNDHYGWKNDKERAKYLMPIALAQLNTVGENRDKWYETLRKLVKRSEFEIWLDHCDDQGFDEHFKLLKAAKTPAQKKRAIAVVKEFCDCVGDNPDFYDEDLEENLQNNLYDPRKFATAMLQAYKKCPHKGQVKFKK